MKFLHRIFLISAWVFAAAANADQAISLSSPESVGVSTERLARITPAMQTYIDQQKLAGIMTLIAKDGKVVWLSAQGQQDIAANKPLKEDAIFRIYSMTKPVTAVAALTLWEQGKFHMFDPIDKYLPELSNLKVYVRGSGDNMELEDQKAPVRIIDLFMHTAGFSYGFTNSEVDKLYQASVRKQPASSTEETLKRVAELPLAYQPGTRWHYGINTDIIGFLVERLTGKKLGEYMNEVIFTPLGMQDTGFSVPADKRHRLVEIYTADETGKTVVMTQAPIGNYEVDPDVHNGGGGLASTMADYYKFASMMLNDGEYNGVRILGRKTMQYMRSNHLPADLVPFNQESSGEGYGLAVSVTVDPGQSGYLSSEGNFGWGGMASTYFRVDPKEKIILIAMAQFVPIGFHRYHDDFRNLAYQALIE